ncbi:MAG: permease prefix domain 1-containing protein [Planctomycetota bacterium]|jgi:hypothetical protein
MDEIDRIVERVCRSVGGSRSLRRHLREELRAHFEEAVEAYIGEGRSREEALKMATDDFGKPEAVEKDLEGVHGRSLLGVVVAKAMDWKERNLRNGWKWSFAAMSTLVVFIAMQIFLIVLPFVFIFPGMQEHYRILGEPMPLLPATALKAARFLFGGAALPAWALLVLVVLGWGLFEWHSKSENKALIRLACAVFFNALITAAFAFTAIATAFGLAEAASYTFHADPRPFTLSCLSDARRAMEDLRHAVEAQDTQAVDHAESLFNAALRNLRSGRQAAALAATSQPGQVETLQSMMQTMEKQSRQVRLDRRPEDVDALADTWKRFCSEVNYTPVTTAPSAASMP